MKTIFKNSLIIMIAASGTFALNNTIAQSMEGGGTTACCSAGTTKLCFIVTVNGQQTAQCNETQGSTKDCS